MNNGETTTAPPVRISRGITRLQPRGGNLLWKMLGIAFLIHMVLVLLTSRNMLFSSKETPEQIFERGEAAMAAGKYLEAQDLYNRVLELQPKVAPVFEKAAEQHRAAERLARLAAAKLATTREAQSPASQPATQPVKLDPIKVKPPDKTRPDFEVPPELRGK